MKIFILVPYNVQMCVSAPLGINEKYPVLMLQTWHSSSFKNLHEMSVELSSS